MTNQTGEPEHNPTVQSTYGLAVASMVLGLLWLFWIGSLLALIFGYAALHQIKQSGGRESGRGMAIAGVVLGWLGLPGLLAIMVLAVMAAGRTG